MIEVNDIVTGRTMIALITPINASANILFLLFMKKYPGIITEDVESEEITMFIYYNLSKFLL